MIKAIIVDDEQHCIDRLTQLLKDHHSETVYIASSFSSVDTATKGIENLKPSLVFLDVEIHDKTGFDLLKQIPVNFDVIFTTAYDKYAVQAFKYSALDYLLKPVDADELHNAIQKLHNKLTGNEMLQKLDVLYYNIKNMQSPTTRICVPVSSGFIFIQAADIIRCESSINYTTLYLKDKQKHVVAKTLKEFEEILAGLNFFRIHNSHFINMAYVKNYNRGKGGTVTMIDGSELEVSTRRKDEFLKAIQQRQ